MKVSVTNLGPVKEATVELGGLTVFVGPNGSGKSYLGKVLYGLQSAETLAVSVFGHTNDFYQILFGENVGTFNEAFAHLQQITTTDLNNALPTLANLHAELFKNRLAEFFNDDCNLFANTKISFSNVNSISEEQLQSILKTTLAQANPKAHTILTQPTTEQLVWYLCWNIFWFVGGGNAEYFPAARSNFMLTYKALYRARADEHVGLEAISDKLLLASKGNHTRKTGSLNRYDKPTEDFISHLYDLDIERHGLSTEIVDKLQSRLYGSDKLLVLQAEGALPDFRYQVNNTDNKLRLHLTSSMVTETSPLLIGLRHWVALGSLVIIDEPESHLHPEAQRELVYGLAELVNQGLSVLLITHSPYILFCINNLIKFNTLVQKYPDDNNVNKLRESQSDLVVLNQAVQAYHFGMDGIVNNIVLESGLIDEAEFTEPFDKINQLYEDMRDIDWEHQS